MVIGAYIVTSYFIFVEKNPDKDKQEIYQTIEKVLKEIQISDLEDLGNLQESQPNLNSTQFKLTDLIDEKSLSFIKKFDVLMDNISIKNSWLWN